jgi:hypothetical protein
MSKVNSLTHPLQATPAPSDDLLSVPVFPPSVPPSVSSITEATDIPSVRSTLETISSEDSPGPSLTDEVSRLLDYLREIDDMRGDENRALADNIQAIRSELGGLADFLRTRLPPTIVERPPPVPQKDYVDRSFGRSSVSPAGPREAPMQPIRATITRGVDARLIPLPRTPQSQWSRPSSPSSLSETVSFLSSHHSDDLSLLEAEEATYPASGSPSWSELSAESDAISVSSSDWGTEDTISDEADIPLVVAPSIPLVAAPSTDSEIPVSSASEDFPDSVSSLVSSATPVQIMPRPESMAITASSETSGTYLSRSSSPSGSTISSATARPRGTEPGANLPQLVDQLREQIEAMKEGQAAANDVLNELRERAMAPEIVDKLAKLEDMLNNVLAQSRRPPRPPTDTMYSDESMTSSALERLRERWEEQTQMRDEPPTIYMPTPVPARPTLDEQLEALLNSVPPLPPASVQAPPPLIPLVYRPVPRAPRVRSPSPVSFMGLTERPLTAPPMEYPEQPNRRPWRPPHHVHRPPRSTARTADTVSEFTDAPRTEYTVHTTGGGTSRGGGNKRPVNDGFDEDFEKRLRELRKIRQGGGDGVMNYATGHAPVSDNNKLLESS